MVSQFGQKDTELNLYENQLAEILTMIAHYQGEHDEIWKRIFALFTEQVGEGNPAKFICGDGFVLAREIHRQTPKLDEARLKKLIYELYPKVKAQRLWADCTVIERKVDQTKLARLVENERIAMSIVEQCVKEVEPAAHRVRRRANRQDAQLLEMGVFTAEEGVEEVRMRHDG